jgi:hypothetical protein
MFAVRLDRPTMTEIDLYLDRIELGAQVEATGGDPFLDGEAGAEPDDSPASAERTGADVLAGVMAAFVAVETAAGKDTAVKGLGTQRNRLLATVNRADLGSKFQTLDEFVADLPAVALFEAKLGTQPGGSDPTKEGTRSGPTPDSTDGPVDVESTSDGGADLYEGDIPEGEYLTSGELGGDK